MTRIATIGLIGLLMAVALAGCTDGGDNGGGDGGNTTTPGTGNGGGGDSGREFMSDPEVRRALSYAFPYQTVRDQVYQGYMNELPGPIPQGMPFADTQQAVYSEDLEQAAQILDEAGYAAQDGVRFGGEPIRIYYNSGNTEREQMAQLLQQNLEQIGILTEVQPLPWPQFLERMFETRDWDIMFLGWGADYNDPDDYWFPFAASASIEGYPDLHGDTFNTGYSSAELDDILIRAKFATDEGERADLYRQAHELYMSEPALIFIGQQQRVMTMRDTVENFTYNPMVARPGYFYSMSKADGAQNPDQIVYATYGEPKTLDPADAYDTASGLQIQNIYDTLVRYEGENTEDVVPRLATSWNVSEDGKTYTFNLREGVQFSNGNEFNASDVVYSFQRVLRLGAPESGVDWILSQSLEPDNITALDDHTVEMTLKQPYGGFLPTIAYTVGSIIDMEYCEENGGMPTVDESGNVTDTGCAEHLKENPMGTNAYKLERWEKDSEVVLTRNENYWEGWDGDHFQRAVTRNIEEPNTRILALQEGTVDIAEIDLDKLDQVRNREGIIVEAYDSYDVVLGVMQTNPSAG